MAIRLKLPSCARVREVLDYDPRTGAVVWRISYRKVVAGTAAGMFRKDGQYLIGIDGQMYRGTRIIWLWMMGVEPPEYIDHADTYRRNNAWDNLRDATNSQNMANRGAQVNKVSHPLKGAYCQWNGSWYSRISKDGVDHCLGTFSSAEAAHAAYMEKARELFGDFARAA